MPWFNVDDGLAFHRKVIKAGNAAMGLWVRAGSHCAQQLTDGFVDAEMVPSLGTLKQADRLVLAGLWIRADGGFQYHEWSADGRNPTRAEVLARRSRNAERKAKQRAKIHPNPEEPQFRDDSRSGTHRGVTGGVTGGVSDPPPLPSLKGQQQDLGGSVPVGKRARKKTAAELAGTAHSTTAHRLVEDYAATCHKRPPVDVVSALAVQVDRLLAEDWSPDELRPVIAVWGAKGLHPKTLPSVAHEVANSNPVAAARPVASPTDAFAAQFLAGTIPTLRAITGGNGC